MWKLWRALGALLVVAACHALLAPPARADGALEALVVRAALAEGVDPRLALCIVGRESSWNPAAVGDRGRAVGLWQWHLPSWQHVRRQMGLDAADQRDDPEAASRAACWALARGYARWWSTYPHCAQEMRMQAAYEAPDLEGLWDSSVRAWARRGFAVVDRPLSTHDGLLLWWKGRVAFQEGLPLERRLLVTAHEMAHWHLREAEVSFAQTDEAEFVAELVAELVCQRLGLGLEAHSAPFLAECAARLGRAPEDLRAAHTARAGRLAAEIVAEWCAEMSCKNVDNEDTL